MPVVAFDIDGTLLDVDAGTDYEDPESVRRGARPHAPSVERVREIASAGHRVAYVTGRCPHLRTLTISQLFIRAKLPVGLLVMQPAWNGYGVMAKWKGQTLGDIGASVYVGDHDADREAARIAGIPFIHVDEFRAGALVPPSSPSLCDHGRPFYSRSGREYPCGDCGRA